MGAETNIQKETRGEAGGMIEKERKMIAREKERLGSKGDNPVE